MHAGCAEWKISCDEPQRRRGRYGAAGELVDGRAALPPVDRVQAVRAPGGEGPLPYAPGQTRDQRLMSLFRLVTAPVPGTGHTYIVADQRALGWRALPIEMYRFADGVYVLACADSSVVGSEVLHLHLRLSEAGPAVFLDSELHAVPGTRLSTDIRDTYLTRTPGEEGLSLVWKDTTYALSPAAPDAVAPIEHVRAGHLDRGAAELRAAMDARMKLGNNLIESPFTFQRGRPETVLPYPEWAARLCPTSWRVQANLARAYARTGQTDRARKALRTARRLDVRRYPSLSRSLGLEASGGV